MSACLETVLGVRRDIAIRVYLQLDKELGNVEETYRIADGRKPNGQSLTVKASIVADRFLVIGNGL